LNEIDSNDLKEKHKSKKDSLATQTQTTFVNHSTTTATADQLWLQNDTALTENTEFDQSGAVRMVVT
jgi:hypothetical protein